MTMNGHPAAPTPPRFHLVIEGKVQAAESAEAAAQILVTHVRKGGAITVKVADTELGQQSGFNVPAVEPVPAVDAALLREVASTLMQFADQVGIGTAQPHVPVLNEILFRMRKALEGRPPIIVVPG